MNLDMFNRVWKIKGHSNNWSISFNYLNGMTEVVEIGPDEKLFIHKNVTYNITPKSIQIMKKNNNYYTWMITHNYTNGLELWVSGQGGAMNFPMTALY